MGDFEEFAEMAEAVAKLGDTPPEIAPEPEPKAVEAEPQTDPAPDAVDVLSGGLGQPLEQAEDKPLTVDDVLGLGPKAEEDQPKPDEQKQEKPEPEEPKPGSMDARLAELTAENRVLKEDRDRFVDQAFKRGEEKPAEEAVPLELDQDVLDYLEPFVEQLTGKKISELQNDMRPMKEQAHNTGLAREIAKHVDGFKPEDMTKLYAELNGMSEEDRAFYEGGVQGAVVLAKDLQSRGALSGSKKPTRRTSSLASRHVSESTGAAPADPDSMGDEEKARQLDAMSGDQIRDILDRLEY